MGDDVVMETTATRATAWRLFAGSLFNEGAIGFFFTLWPLYIASLGASPAEIGLVIGASGVLRLLFLLPSSWLVDRFSLRLLVAGMRAVAALGFILCALVREWWQLFPGLIAINAGVIAFPALSTLIAGLGRASEERTRYFTMIYTVAPSIATILTPAAAGWLAERWGLRATLVAASLATAAAAATFATVRVPEHATASTAGGSYRELLYHRSILLSAGLMVATIGGMMLGWVLAPNYLQEVHGVSLERIGWLGSIAACETRSIRSWWRRERWQQALRSSCSGAISASLSSPTSCVEGFWSLGRHFIRSSESSHRSTCARACSRWLRSSAASARQSPRSSLASSTNSIHACRSRPAWSAASRSSSQRGQCAVPL
jgi:MFS family permease